MSAFISWVRRRSDGKLFFLADEEVFSQTFGDRLGLVREHDPLGHGAIRAYYTALDLDWRCDEREERDFWRHDLLPPVIAEKVKHFNRNFGRMWRAGCWHADDLAYIMRKGPLLWKYKAARRALMQFRMFNPTDLWDVTKAAPVGVTKLLLLLTWPPRFLAWRFKEG